MDFKPNKKPGIYTRKCVRKLRGKRVDEWEREGKSQQPKS